MENKEAIKQVVKDKYHQIASQDKEANAASCCGSGDASDEVYNIMNDDYSELEGYEEEADLGLGCGLPTQFALIEEGDTIIDLGSGAGNDCFVARNETGPTGKVIGIDFVESMVTKARENAEQLGYNNVEFRFGDIEAMPVSDNSADVVVSNCVLNLLPNKEDIFKEIYRVLNPAGHFSISDIVLLGELPEGLKNDAEMYAGCVSGAIQKDQYLHLVKDAGFQNITIQKEKAINLPNDILKCYLSETELQQFNRNGTGVFSITVYAEKPGAQGQKPKRTVQSSELNDQGCDPNAGCC